MTTKDALNTYRKSACTQCETVERLATIVERANGMDEVWLNKIRELRMRVTEARNSIAEKEDPRPDAPDGDLPSTDGI
jgi:hypothetical protein